MVPFAYKQYCGLSLPQLQIVNFQLSIINLPVIISKNKSLFRGNLF
ncbi:hypothetical protein ES703_70312 [subsurface metagenome]